MQRWVLDLDGVVWRGSQLLPGAGDAVDRLLAAGHEVIFCTNHAQSPAVKRSVLDAFGVADAPVVTSGQAAAAACRNGDRVLILGDSSLCELFEARGVTAIDVHGLPDGSTVPEVDAVVVGACPDWDRSRVGMAADAIRSGARFLATNDDPTYPVMGPDGPRLLPGNGALVAAVATAAGRSAEVTGKPHAAMVDLLVGLYGRVDVMVGDKPETDGELAVALGARYGLVLTGVTAAADLPVVPTPWLVGTDLGDLVDRALTTDGYRDSVV